MEDEQSKRKTWDLFIGISMILFGAFWFYNRRHIAFEWNLDTIWSILYLVAGTYLIIRYFTKKDR